MEISYSVENLRRIKNMPPITVKPITILVGRNSAGKSTFLRTFPLLRQSLATKSSAPILWFGDYADFGDFQSSVRNNDLDAEIKFAFEVKNLSAMYRPYTERQTLRQPQLQRPWRIEVDSLSVEYFIGQYDNETVLNHIHLKVPSSDTTIDIRFDKKEKKSSIIIDKFDFFPKLSANKLMSLNNSLFSPPFFLKSQKTDEGTRSVYAPVDDLFFEALKNEFMGIIPKNVSENTIDGEVRKLLRTDILDRIKIKKMSINSSTKAFKKLYEKLLVSPDDIFSRRILQYWKLYRAFTVLEALDSQLTSFFSSVTYLGPARARSERFYRKQELQVSEISPDGENFPMFLASLADHDLQRFSNWVKSVFGYGVRIENIKGHISILLQSDEHTVNVTDTGYGVSQLLPVLGQIWRVIDGDSYQLYHQPYRGRGVQTLAIEQPELHLHPAHQALLADVFELAVMNGLNKKSRKVNFVIETHSEALINRLGEIIEEGRLSKDDIQIVVFGASDDLHSASDISISKFNSDGVLVDWPFGFFNYSSK